MRTRRELILGGLGLAAGGGFGSAVLPAAAAAAAKPVPSDGQLIQGLLGVEQLVAFIYERALRSGELRPRTARLTRQLLAHERAHARALSAQLPALEVFLVPVAPRTDDEAERALRQHHTVLRVDRHRSNGQWTKLMLDLEDVLERNYHMAISELREPVLLRLCAEILASEAQHSALLGEQLDPHRAAKALPDMFINGA
jgi:hypothetical protein